MKPRSNAQLRYAFGVVMKSLMEFTASRGVPLSKEEVKRHAYIAVGHCEMQQVFGEFKVVPKPTPKDVQGMEELLEKIRAWAAGFGLTIYLPGEGTKYPIWPEEDL